eukprot:TRINITY_DN4228_c0_g3_i1.p1 TRINITY_DN4228_c0_g3~~TRINITY_DN4228_c0_g3_i1.p1  ORF type:complete len:306 (-),score=69.32 TRINITY_DN4228_c0_g3_i1:391-1197(-)
MATISGRVKGLLLVVVLVVLLETANAILLEPEGEAVKSDIPFIKCSVCQHVAKQLAKHVQRKKDDKAPKKLAELEVIDVVERICDRKKDQGNWIEYLDIQEAGTELELKEFEYRGECRNECRTIERTCQQIIGEHDTDIGEVIFTKFLGGADEEVDEDGIEEALCNSITDSCEMEPPPVPKSRGLGEEYIKYEEKHMDMKKAAKEMGIKERVFHGDDKANVDLLDRGYPRLDPPKHLRNQKQQPGPPMRSKMTGGPPRDEKISSFDEL